MWGTLLFSIVPINFFRFIPTHVGNTLHEAQTHEENCGSSPRMWGTPALAHLGEQEVRFIPTHVGNTHHLHGWYWLLPVHPHACGEHIAARLQIELLNGSSPRMWGTRFVRAKQSRRWRFIPTHVGNTIFSTGIYFFNSVHPHACGEHPVHHLFHAGNCGSSPRMWGTLRGVEKPDCSGRFIPTHVGNTGMVAVRC